MNSRVDTMEGFFDNVSHSPNIDTITKLFNEWIETEYEWGLKYPVKLTHYIPGAVFEFNPKKFIFSIYSNVFKYIRYDIQISDFIKDVMASIDSDDSYITCQCKFNEDKSVLNIQLEYRNGNIDGMVTRSYTLKLIPSPFAKMRGAFLNENGVGDWITDAMDHLEVNQKSKAKHTVEDIKKAIKEIYDLL